MFFGGHIHLVHDTKWEGVVGHLKFFKFPLSDHGVHAKIVQTPLAGDGKLENRLENKL